MIHQEEQQLRAVISTHSSGSKNEVPVLQLGSHPGPPSPLLLPTLPCHLSPALAGGDRGFGGLRACLCRLDADGRARAPFAAQTGTTWLWELGKTRAQTGSNRVPTTLLGSAGTQAIHAEVTQPCPLLLPTLGSTSRGKIQSESSLPRLHHALGCSCTF